MKQHILFRAHVIFNIKGYHVRSAKRTKAIRSWHRVARRYLKPALLVALLAIIACSACGKSKKMTAKEYYRYLLAENGYEVDENAEQKVEEFKILIEKRKWLKLSDAELKKMAEAINAGEMLIPLLNDLLDNMPDKYKLDNPDIYVGVFPLKDFNARTLRAPNGGILILVNRGLTKGLYEWAKLIFNIVFLQLDHPELPPDAPLKKILELFNESFRSYAKSRTFPSFPDYATDEKGVLASALCASAMEFVLAHEYAHALLGHIDSDLLSNPKDRSAKSGLLPEGYLKRESDTDLIAAEIFLQPQQDESSAKKAIFNTEMRLAGIYYNLIMFEVLENLELDVKTVESGTYPQMVIRIGNVKAQLEKTLDLSKYPIANDVARALDVALNASTVENPPPEKLKGDELLKKKFYLAFKSKNESEMSEMVSRNSEKFARWAGELLELADIFAKGNLASSAAIWSDGDFMASSDQFTLALKINTLYRKKMNRDALKDIFGRGAAILGALQQSAKQFEARGIASASQHKLKQAKIIEQALALEPATQSKY